MPNDESDCFGIGHLAFGIDQIFTRGRLMDFYTILGLSPGASVSDVKRAYRRLSRRYHPGINPGDRAAEAMFQRISEAYDTLVDAERRRLYEQAQAPPAVRNDIAPAFSGFDFSVKAHGPQAATFSELFAEALHPMTQRGTSQPGADLHAALTLTLAESMRGSEQSVTVTRHVACATCRASGTIQVADEPCRPCRGSGQIRWARGHMVFTKPCGTCAGTGREARRSCPACVGNGRVPRAETLSVRIPAGIVDGARVQVPGYGHAGTHGARPGDLYVTVSIRPDPVLRREGDDLHMVLPIGVPEAVLGARIEVPSFDGPLRVRIPPGTQGGQRFRISGRGAVTVSGRRGDLLVEVRLMLPAVLDERSKDLMREFARLHPEGVRGPLVEHDSRQN
jgi:molecular chaperone DnaJ